MRRTLQPVELQAHIGRVVGLFEHLVFFLEIEQGARRNRHHQTVVQVGGHGGLT
ncbi:hypothetical protein GALL_555070 [mine drainage metagenome]|uniref:Uncharacterized protein n=1 Tax=mine drainage metagenome TaxID=410659 RepID=A0A1J5P570_9ZZZZ